MSNLSRIELFILKSAAMQAQASDESSNNLDLKNIENDELLGDFINQFSSSNRYNAASMALYYQAFYLLENHIRGLVVDTLSSVVEEGKDWWEEYVPDGVKDEAERNRKREETSGMRFRSENLIDYITFGQLSDIIKDNWDFFGGAFTSKSAVLRILSSLNSLRGPIAHCGLLPEDEIARLRISIRDWFYVAA